MTKTAKSGTSSKPHTQGGVNPTEAALVLSDEYSPLALQRLPLTDLLDKFGALDNELPTHKAFVKKHETVRLEIERRVNDTQAADAIVTMAGREYDVTVGARAKEREIKNPAKLFDLVRKAVGVGEKFKSLCRFHFKDLDSLSLAAKSLEGVITEAHTGRRKVETVKKAVPANAVQAA